MKLLECINDTGYSPEHLKYIVQFPVLGEIYTLKSKMAVGNGEIGYILEELSNPPMPNNTIPSFNSKRFREVPDMNIDELLKQTHENTYDKGYK